MSLLWYQPPFPTGALTQTHTHTGSTKYNLQPIKIHRDLIFPHEITRIMEICLTEQQLPISSMSVKGTFFELATPKHSHPHPFRTKFQRYSMEWTIQLRLSSSNHFIGSALLSKIGSALLSNLYPLMNNRSKPQTPKGTHTTHSNKATNSTCLNLTLTFNKLIPRQFNLVYLSHPTLLPPYSSVVHSDRLRRCIPGEKRTDLARKPTSNKN